jgi:kynurenine formamidase
MKQFQYIIVLSALVGCPLWIEARTMMSEPERPVMTKNDVEVKFRKLSNWGRWGKDDELGALNLITPAKRREAAAQVREGISISLAHDAIKKQVRNSPPFEHRMVETGTNPDSGYSADVYSVQYHGYTEAHIDALCHVFHEGKMYNGIPQATVTEKGAGRLSVMTMKNGIVSRGVLMDFPRLFGVKFLEGSRAIMPQDLEAWEKSTGVKITPGDIVLIQTGRWTRYAAEGEWDFEGNSAGLDVSCLPWFRERDVAILGSDLALDRMPSGVEGVRMPVHLITIVSMGTPILDNLDLEPLAEAVHQRKRWTFMLTVAPLTVPGGTGSPVNPIAVF